MRQHPFSLCEYEYLKMKSRCQSIFLPRLDFSHLRLLGGFFGGCFGCQLLLPQLFVRLLLLGGLCRWQDNSTALGNDQKLEK